MWAKAHRDWTVSDWSKVLWTDESAFQLFPGGEQYVWRKKGEEFKEENLAPTVKHGGFGGVSTIQELEYLKGLKVLLMPKRINKYLYIKQCLS